MLQIAGVAFAVVFLGSLFKQEAKNGWQMILALGATLLVAGYSLERLKELYLFMKELFDMLPLDPLFFSILVKLLVVTYLTDFASGMCKEQGYSTLGTQVEIFGKVTILFVTIPAITYLLQVFAILGGE